MFTGLIQCVARISSATERGGDLRLSVASDSFDFSIYEEGESIAVSGVCLTALNIGSSGFEADVSRETLDATTIGRLKPGALVNIEPSLAVGDRLGGHWVSGHVDGVGTVVSLHEDARSVRLGVDMPADLHRYVARKGSVAVDGISLTINALRPSGFELNIIPHTLSATTLQDVKVGDAVNIEVDLLARYLERFHTSDAPESTISREFLEKNGYDR